MTTEELEKIVSRYEMQRLELKAGGGEILDAHDFKGNIQDQVDEAVTFIKRNIRCAIVNTPGKVDHDSVWDYPIEALRESLANAVCHRDYGSPHDIQLRIYDDSVAISSPGQLRSICRWSCC